MMDGEQFRAICQREGVTPRLAKRGNKMYIYVARWIPDETSKNKSGGKMHDRYVCPASKIEELDEAKLMRFINVLPINPNKDKPAPELKAYDYLFGASDGSDKT